MQTDAPLAQLGYAEPTVSLPMKRVGDGGGSPGFATVAEEVPVALVYNARPHVVVMATPADLVDLAYGFSLSERIVDHVSQIARVEVVKASHGIELQIEIPAREAEALLGRARGLVARTGCGLCGVETIRDAVRVPAAVTRDFRVPEAAIWRAARELSERQALNRETNAVHGASWVLPDGDTQFVREDVGRHNALDKLLGALARDGRDPSSGFVVVTSRASYEMVQKAATSGVELLAAISRPTGLAVRFAEAAGLTLVGLLRGTSANVYTGHERIL
jgi:FdhD protein